MGILWGEERNQERNGAHRASELVLRFLQKLSCSSTFIPFYYSALYQHYWSWQNSPCWSCFLKNQFLSLPVNSIWISWDSSISESFRFPVAFFCFSHSGRYHACWLLACPYQLTFWSFDWGALTPNFVVNAVQGFFFFLHYPQLIFR